MLSYFTSTDASSSTGNRTITIGLSTDTKPTAISHPTLFTSGGVFIEEDTGKLFRLEGGSYVEKTASVQASQAFPIGSVFISVVSTNPATLLGYGTWSAFGAGRVLVGLDAGQTEFDTAEETGGFKTHTLTVNEIPAHTHTQDAHSHTYKSQTATTGTATSYEHGAIDTSSTQANEGGVTDTTVATNQNTGGGAAHNNLQPYVVCYFWKRTA
jgi:hypothetical protein